MCRENTKEVNSIEFDIVRKHYELSVTIIMYLCIMIN